MDGGILALIITGVGLLGGAIGWLSSQYWQRRTAKREAAHDASESLKDKKTLLEEMISETQDTSSKQELLTQLDEVNHALLGLYAQRLRKTLKDAGLPPEETLIIDGRSRLHPQQIAQLRGIVTEVNALPSFLSTQDLLVLGNAYYYMEQYRDAEKIYDRVLDLNPDDLGILFNRGTTYGRLGRYDEALADFNRCLELGLNAPGVFSNRGATYIRLERYDEALASFNLALEVEPDFANALVNRGTTYIRLERYDEALADYDRSLELKPDYPEVLYNKACLFSLWQKTDDALAYLEKAIGVDKKNLEDARTEKDFDNIRDDPRFKRLMESN